jgi:5-methylcytosine-specific restriction endonuclease McrA
MFCKRCTKELIGKQISYCSGNCSKLHLKSLYKKRNLAKLRIYNRARRLAVKSAGATFINSEKMPKIREQLGGVCERCGRTEKLEIHHMKPLENGGSNQVPNLVLFCHSCHAVWHQKLKGFWLT